MNVFNKVTLESLKKNRTRTVVTIIGIMLSAAMICASTTLVSSMQNFVLRCAIHIDGNWYGAVYDAAYKDYEDIRDSDSLRITCDGMRACSKASLLRSCSRR